MFDFCQSPTAFGASCKLCSASSSEKLPGFWLGGNSLNVAEELSDVLLRWHQDEGVIDPPPAVIYALMIGRLEWIGAQVE